MLLILQKPASCLRRQYTLSRPMCSPSVQRPPGAPPCWLLLGHRPFMCFVHVLHVYVSPLCLRSVAVRFGSLGSCAFQCVSLCVLRFVSCHYVFYVPVQSQMSTTRAKSNNNDEFWSRRLSAAVGLIAPCVAACVSSSPSTGYGRGTPWPYIQTSQSVGNSRCTVRFAPGPDL